MDIKRSIPEGTQDYLPLECAHKQALQRRMDDVAARWGYRAIETSTLEYMEAVAAQGGAFELERLFKLVDGRGRVLALRPDMTMPTARLAATRLAEQPLLRLCYRGNVFNFQGDDSTGGLKEYTQMGVELMGVGQEDGDAEVIALAVAMLREAGLQGFQLDIGQVDFFRGLMEEAGFAGPEMEAVCQLVERKDYLALELRLQQAGVPEELKNRILEVPSLYGGVEVLDKARHYGRSARCVRAVDSVAQIVSRLADYGVEGDISIDLGMVQSIHYYTGLIFRGMVENLGYPLLTGGRYDNLVAEYGRPLPATGFAVNVKAVLIALERQGALAGDPSAVDKVVGFDPSARSGAIRQMAMWRAAGERVEQFYGGPEELAAYAARRGAALGLWVGPDGIMQLYPEGRP